MIRTNEIGTRFQQDFFIWITALQLLALNDECCTILTIYLTNRLNEDHIPDQHYMAWHTRINALPHTYKHTHSHSSTHRRSHQVHFHITEILSMSKGAKNRYAYTYTAEADHIKHTGDVADHNLMTTSLPPTWITWLSLSSCSHNTAG